jgi:hypothetical protein
MSRATEARELMRMKLNEAHEMYMRHELARIQCEMGNGPSEDARGGAARWKRVYEALCGAWERGSNAEVDSVRSFVEEVERMAVDEMALGGNHEGGSFREGTRV